MLLPLSTLIATGRTDRVRGKARSRAQDAARTARSHESS